MLALVDISLSAWMSTKKRRAVVNILDRLNERSMRSLTVMAFNRGVQRVTLEKLAGLQPSGATDISGALAIALELDSPIVVLITDGQVVYPDTDQAVMEVAEACRDKNLRVHCLSLLDDHQVNDDLLATIADRTGGLYMKIEKEIDPLMRRVLALLLEPIKRKP